MVILIVMPIVYTDALVKNFGNVQALRQLTLKLEKGVTGLVGPNGAGKTTTIGVILGLLRPDGGRASVFGFDCWRESFEVRKRVGVLHEKPVYPGSFRGRKYLEHAARFYGVDRSCERAAEMLKTVGLSEAGDRNIGTYSAGMVQRLGLAQALIGEPEFVILDEPTANLDPIGRVEFLERIRELQLEKGISFMISTHVLGELEIVCDQVAIINKGVMREQGRMEELAKKYRPTVFTIVVSEPRILAAELGKAGWAKRVKVEAGGKLVVETDMRQRLLEELIRVIQEHNMELISMGPQYGTLEAIYRGAMEETGNV